MNAIARPLHDLGRATLGAVAGVGYAAALLAESLYYLVAGGRVGQRVRLSAIARQMREIGVDALPIVALLGFAVVQRAVNSPFGAVLQAIRENEPRALSLGYRVERVKLLAFVLSAALAGTAGALKAIVLDAATLTDIRWTMSGEVVLMTLLGWLGTLTGPIAGAFTVAGLESWLASVGQAAEVAPWLRALTSAQVVMGLIFIACVLVFRRGLVGELQHVMKRNLNL